MSKEIQKHIQEIFQIEELLGSGAYGHVWKVIEKSTQKRFALKKVFDAFQNDVDSQRTYREITILYQLKHPHIIDLKGVIKSKNKKDLYILFQYMQTDLHSLVGQSILEVPHLLYIVYQMFKALKYIHSAQLIHRDLKPSNVLINSDCQIKLCDFGLVRSLTREEDSILILSEDVATRWYRSPEMLLGSQNYNASTDIWSVGCIIAELMIGQPLLMGNSNVQQLQKILELSGPPSTQDIHSLRSNVAETLLNEFRVIKKPFKRYFRSSRFESQVQLVNLVRRMLQFNPEKRITVQQVLNHQLFNDSRCASQETICQRIIIPDLDDNVRLDVDDYRKAIELDIERRYPQYNPKQESLSRFIRGHNSLINRTVSMPSFKRSGAHSVFRPKEIGRGIAHKQRMKQMIKSINGPNSNSVYHNSIEQNPKSCTIHNNSMGKLIKSLHQQAVGTKEPKSPFKRVKKYHQNIPNNCHSFLQVKGLQQSNSNVSFQQKQNNDKEFELKNKNLGNKHYEAPKGVRKQQGFHKPKIARRTFNRQKKQYVEEKRKTYLHSTAMS